jgi:putative transposase
MELKDNTVEKLCKRYNVPNHGHELTFSCYHRLPLLQNRLFCEYLVEAIVSAQQSHGFDVWAYVFMPEHVHLMFCPIRQPYSISAILKSIKQSVSRRAINWLRQHQPDIIGQLTTGQKHEKVRFWQDGGGYDRNIFSYKAARNCVYYIHHNPVKRGLAQQPSQWYYSSYNQMYKKGESPLAVSLRYFPRQ